MGIPQKLCFWLWFSLNHHPTHYALCSFLYYVYYVERNQDSSLATFTRPLSKDPFLPYHLIICMENLYIAINDVDHRDSSKSIYMSRNVPYLSIFFLLMTSFCLQMERNLNSELLLIYLKILAMLQTWRLTLSSFVFSYPQEFFREKPSNYDHLKYSHPNI